MNKINWYIQNPGVSIKKIQERLLWLLPDKLFLKVKFRKEMGKKLNLKNPQTYSEKLQWLKLYYRCPEYTNLVDKYEVKEFVANLIGREYIIPTLGVWNNVEDIEWTKLPKQFVLKCTHDSGGIVICRDKSVLDKQAAMVKLRLGQHHDYYRGNREWPYKNVPRRILAEEFMVDESGTELKDYKFFCFDGVPKAMFIATDRSNPDVETKFDFFDMDFNHLPFTNGHPNSLKPVVKPEGFDEMKEIAAKLSKGMPHVRVDLYNINGHIYFGELTFFHWSGMVPFVPEEWDYTFGSWIKLPSKRD